MRNTEAGFTLLELLVAVALVGVLSSLSVSVFNQYREKAYESVVKRTLQDGRTALQTGLGSLEDQNINSNVVVIQNDQAGSIVDPDGDTLVPGLKLSGDLLFLAVYNPNCTTDECYTHLIAVRHCKTRYQEQLIRYGDGVVTVLELTSFAGC